MNKSWKEIAPDTYIDFDDKNGTISISENQSLIPGFHKIFTKTTTFATAKEWDESPYSKHVRSDYVKDMITWFWIDHDTPITQ